MKIRERDMFYKSDSKMVQKDKEFWYDYFYNRREIALFQDFSTEHYYAMKGMINIGLIQRYLCVLICIGNLGLGLAAWDFRRFFLFFTNWTQFITLVSVVYSINMASDLQSMKNTHKLALHHILYTLAILMNFVTVSIYWSLIHMQVVGTVKSKLQLLDLYTAHIVPGLVCILNSYHTNAVLSRKNVKHVAGLLIFYGLINLAETKYTGEPLYYFLTWESIDSVVISSGILLFVCLAYVLLCKFDEIVKHDSLIKKNKHKLKTLDSKSVKLE
jgi:hypothetical protein